MKFQRRYDEQGRVAVLISPGFGAGWSSWANPKDAEALLFDSRLVDAVLAKMPVDQFQTYCESIGYDHYIGGAGELTVVWLEPGTRFSIEEYDGSENLLTFDNLHYVA